MNVHFQCVIQVCRYNCPDPVCPEESASQQSINVTPASASYSVNSNAGTVTGDGALAPDTYVVNPRVPSVLPATRRHFRKPLGATRFSARRGREGEMDYSDMAHGLSSQLHQYNLENPYYQQYHQHRVKRHEREMKKSSVGEVSTNSTFQVNGDFLGLL